MAEKKPAATEVATKTTVNPAEINTHEDEMNVVDYTVSYQKKNGAIIPVIDGVEHPELLMGYASEADMKAGLEVLRSALKATGGNIPQAMRYMYNAAMTTAKGIKPAKQLIVDNTELMIDYEAKKIYTLDREEIANLDDLSDEVRAVLNEEAVEAMLVDRAKLKVRELHTNEDDYEDGYDDGYDEGYDDGYDEGYDDGEIFKCDSNSTKRYRAVDGVEGRIKYMKSMKNQTN